MGSIQKQSSFCLALLAATTGLTGCNQEYFTDLAQKYQASQYAHGPVSTMPAPPAPAFPGHGLESGPITHARATCAQISASLAPLASAGLPAHAPKDYSFSASSQTILDSTVGAINGSASSVDVDAQFVDSVTVSAAQLTINAGTVNTVNGASTGQTLIAAGRIGSFNGSSGQVALFARPVDGVVNEIDQLTSSAGEIIVCGFNVRKIAASAGRIIVIGGSVDELDGSFGSVLVPDGTILHGSAGSIGTSGASTR